MATSPTPRPPSADPEVGGAGELDQSRIWRRLSRERNARAEAEAIAERSTRELYQRQQELELLEAVAVAANTMTPEEAMQVAVDRVCMYTGWPVGHAYVLDAAAPQPELSSSGIWHLDDAQRYRSFREITERTRFAPGVGLPGRVLAAGEPAWIIDVTKDLNFPRAQPATDIGVRAAFGFPVMVGDEVVAVLEFFSPQTFMPDDQLLALMAQLGTQLGRVIERQSGQEERAALSRQNELLLESAGEGICGVDAEGRTTFVNPAAARMLGQNPDDLIGKTIHEIVHAAADEGQHHEIGECRIHAAVASKVARSADDVFWRRDRTSFPVEYISTPIDDNGGVQGAVLTFNDIADRKRFESQLRYLAEHDPLTDLCNRRRFEEAVLEAAAYAERYSVHGAVLILDLDNFKYINDTLGHHAGDELIRATAAILRDRLRVSDLVARLGGDEFGILLHAADEQEAQAVAEELAGAIRQHAFTIDGHETRVTASIGLAVLGRQEVSAESLLVEAEVAMYGAKDGGRDRVEVFEAGASDDAGMRVGIAWTERIRRALEEGTFVHFCQPIFDLGRGRVSQYELLLRMLSDDGELIPPGAFLPTAERFGLIESIDEWTVRNAIGILERERRAGRDLDLQIEINLSGRSVGNPDLPRLIESEMDRAKVDPGKLILEITETSAIANMDEARNFANRMSGLGCKMALDDFGAGFGSFYYLKYLPLDFLKIDGEFIRTLPRSPIDQRMVKAMVDIASGLGMRTIAEFVEDADTLELLRVFGVDFAQGYHVGRPQPVDEVIGANTERG